MPKQLPYFPTLGEAFQLLIKFPQIFLPTLIGFLLGLAIAPFGNKLASSEITLPEIAFITLLFIGVYFLLFIVYGWQLSIASQIFKNKKVNLNTSFRNAFPLAWKIFKTGVLLLLLTVAFFLALIIIVVLGVGIGIGVFKLSAVAGIIISVILGIIGLGVLLVLLVLGFWYALYWLQLVPILALEDKTARATIIHTYHYFRQNLGYSTKNGVLSLMIVFLAEVPYFIYLFAINGFVTPPTSWDKMLLAQFTTLPVVIVSLGILLAYCIWYRGKK